MWRLLFLFACLALVPACESRDVALPDPSPQTDLREVGDQSCAEDELAFLLSHRLHLAIEEARLRWNTDADLDQDRRVDHPLLVALGDASGQLESDLFSEWADDRVERFSDVLSVEDLLGEIEMVEAQIVVLAERVGSPLSCDFGDQLRVLLPPEVFSDEVLALVVHSLGMRTEPAPRACSASY